MADEFAGAAGAMLLLCMQPPKVRLLEATLRNMGERTGVEGGHVERGGEQMLKSTMDPKYYVVPIVERTLDIMELLKGTREPMTVAAISDTTGIALSTVYRILRTLVYREYVFRRHNGRYGYVLGKSSMDDVDSCRICKSPRKSSVRLAREVSPKFGGRRPLFKFPITEPIDRPVKR